MLRLAGPRPRGEEEVDPLVDRLGAPGALHRRHERQVEVLDADLLEGLAAGGVVRRLALLDVAGRGRRPVVVHVAGVLPQLEQHLGAAVGRPRSRNTYAAGTTTKRPWSP